MKRRAFGERAAERQVDLDAQLRAQDYLGSPSSANPTNGLDRSREIGLVLTLQPKIPRLHEEIAKAVRDARGPNAEPAVCKKDLPIRNAHRETAGFSDEGHHKG